MQVRAIVRSRDRHANTSPRCVSGGGTKERGFGFRPGSRCQHTSLNHGSLTVRWRDPTGVSVQRLSAERQFLTDCDDTTVGRAWGDERLSGSEKADPHKSERANGAGKASVSSKKASRPTDVGRALRSVYDDTLREDIPDDLKELLGRLG